MGGLIRCVLIFERTKTNSKIKVMDRGVDIRFINTYTTYFTY